jgi:hypothetical protein
MSRLAQIVRSDAIYNYDERFSGSMLAQIVYGDNNQACRPGSSPISLISARLEQPPGLRSVARHGRWSFG